MNLAEALAVVGVVRAGAIPQEMTDDRATELAGYLMPLPYDVCRRAAERWSVSVPLDEKGQPVPKFVSEPGAVLTACGVPFATRHLVDRALRDGGEVFPSVRGAFGDGGWEYAATGATLPRGVAEWYVNAGLALPPNRRVDPALGQSSAHVAAALPPGQPMSAEEQQTNLQRLGALARVLGARRVAPPAPPRPTTDPALIEAELRAFEARRTKGDKTA